MATKAENILGRVQALGYATDTEASQLLALNMLHKRILNFRRWSFLFSTSSTKTLTVGNGTLSIEALAATKRIDAVRLELSPSTFISLDNLPIQEMREFEHVERLTGTPEFWAREGTTLHFWPIPDLAYTVVQDFIENPIELTTGSAEVQIPDSHADILVWGTLMGMTFRERDWDGHNFARQMYSELLAEMSAQYGMTDRQTAKHVTASGFYDVYDPELSWLI